MPERALSLAVADHFALNLRRVRKREDLSQEELARRASLHRTAIGFLEHAERVCRIDTLCCVAGAMGVPPGELLDGILWIPAPDSEGTFTFNPKPYMDQYGDMHKPEGQEEESNQEGDVESD
jgi:transcriptional regulator with XRE-family HTH domain